MTGAAGLLKSFDPRLTPSELRQLLVEGAIKGNRAVPGVDTGRILNIYESLKLAAKRPGAPVCGFPVGLDGLSRLVFYRDSATPEIVPTEGYQAFYPSVAQGGKLIAIQLARPQYPLIYQGKWNNGAWMWDSAPKPVGGESEGRWFLEFDTVDLRINYPNPGGVTLTSLTGPGRPGIRGPKLINKDLWTLPSVLRGGTYDAGWAQSFRADGQWAMVSLLKGVSGQGVEGTYLVKIADNSAFVVSEQPQGVFDNFDHAWSHNGRYWVGAFDTPTGHRYRTVDLSGTPSVLTDVPAPWIQWGTLTFSFDDRYFYSEERTSGPESPCTPVKRRVPDLGVVGKIGPVMNQQCLYPGTGVMLPNSVMGRGRDRLHMNAPRPRPSFFN